LWVESCCFLKTSPVMSLTSLALCIHHSYSTQFTYLKCGFSHIHRDMQPLLKLAPKHFHHIKRNTQYLSHHPKSSIPPNLASTNLLFISWIWLL
jgi:hypothetical protein